MRQTGPLAMLLIVSAALQQPCYAEDNPLIGSWRWDNAKTLANLQIPTEGSEELRKSASEAKTFVEGIATKLHSNVVFTYQERECSQVMYAEDGKILSRETFPYELVEVRRDVIVIDQPRNGGMVTFFREGTESMYVEVNVGAFTYNDYFTREK